LDESVLAEVALGGALGAGAKAEPAQFQPGFAEGHLIGGGAFSGLDSLPAPLPTPRVPPALPTAAAADHLMN